MAFMIPPSQVAPHLYPFSKGVKTAFSFSTAPGSSAMASVASSSGSGRSSGLGWLLEKLEPRQNGLDKGEVAVVVP